MNNIIQFPKDRIVNLIPAEQPKGIHRERIERLLCDLTYELTRACQEGEILPNECFGYNQILSVQRDDNKFTKLRMQVYPSEDILDCPNNY